MFRRSIRYAYREVTEGVIVSEALDTYSMKSARKVLSKITTPLVAQVNAGEKLYGPFRNGEEALEWRDKQPLDVAISFRPLRNPNVKRTLNDFYKPVYLEDEAREFDVYLAADI